MADFVTKDSGKRQQFASGMQRDVQEGKQKPHLCAEGPMFMRWAALMTRGAEKYDENNWMKAEGAEELARFRASAFRHFMQWYYGEADEDHAAAVFFNINGAEYVKGKIAAAEDAAAESARATFEAHLARLRVEDAVLSMKRAIQEDMTGPRFRKLW